MQRLSCPSHPSSMSHNIRAQVGHFNDVAVHCDDGVFYLHRLVLAASSHFLHRLLLETNSASSSSDLDQFCLVLPGVSQGTFRILLDFIYTGEADIDGPLVREVMGLARLLDIKGVVRPKPPSPPPSPPFFVLQDTEMSKINQPQPLKPLRLIRKAKWQCAEQASQFPTKGSRAPLLLSSLLTSSANPRHPPTSRSTVLNWNPHKSLLENLEAAAQISPNLLSSMETVAARVVKDDVPQSESVPCIFQPHKDRVSQELDLDYNRSRTVNQSKIYTCSFCGAWFPRLQALRRHQKRHANSGGPIYQKPPLMTLPTSPVIIATLPPLSTLPVPNIDCLEVYNQFMQFEQSLLGTPSPLLEELEGGFGAGGGGGMDGVQEPGGAHEQSAVAPSLGGNEGADFMPFAFGNDGGVDPADAADQNGAPWSFFIHQT